MTRLNEAARQFYLAQAGIQMWYARAPLPGAAPSPEFDFVEPEPSSQGPVENLSAPAPAQLDAADRSDRSERLARIQGLMGAAVAAPSAPIPNRVVPKQDGTPAVAKRVDQPVPESSGVPNTDKHPPEIKPEEVRSIRAHWGFWVSAHVVLVSSLSGDASYQLQDALAKNILRAMGQTDITGFRIQWPVFNNQLVPGNDRRGFCRIVSEQCRDYGSRQVVLLGLATDLAKDEREELLSSIPGQRFVDFESSLAALSTNPNAKRSLWQLLKAFPGIVR